MCSKDKKTDEIRENRYEIRKRPVVGFSDYEVRYFENALEASLYAGVKIRQVYESIKTGSVTRNGWSFTWEQN